MDGTKETTNPETPDHDATEHEYDLDALLLCPDVIIEENTDDVVTGNVYNGDEFENTCSPLDYNIIGIKAQFKLNSEEELLRSQMYKMGHPVQNSKIHCTACNVHLGSALSCRDNVFIHPLLSTLICRGCFDYYTGGQFEKDEDGTEKFCRWCGQGGQVFCCSKCPIVFCKWCIRINFTASKYSAIRDSDYWECFACDPKSIMPLKVQCYEFSRYIRSEIIKLKNEPETNFYMEIDNTPCCLNEGRKRKSKNRDPDFIPKADDKNIRRPKVPKREGVDLNQTRNLEFSDFLTDVKIMLPLKSEDATRATIDFTVGNPNPIPKPPEIQAVPLPTANPENIRPKTQIILNLKKPANLKRIQNTPESDEVLPNISSLCRPVPLLPQIYSPPPKINFYYPNRPTGPPPPKRVVKQQNYLPGSSVKTPQNPHNKISKSDGDEER